MQEILVRKTSHCSFKHEKVPKYPVPVSNAASEATQFISDLVQNSETAHHQKVEIFWCSVWGRRTQTAGNYNYTRLFVPSAGDFATDTYLAR